MIWRHAGVRNMSILHVAAAFVRGDALCCLLGWDYKNVEESVESQEALRAAQLKQVTISPLVVSDATGSQPPEIAGAFAPASPIHALLGRMAWEAARQDDVQGLNRVLWEADDPFHHINYYHIWT